VRKFEDPNGGDVNYVAFIQAIDEEYTEQVMEMEMERVFSTLSVHLQVRFST